MYTPRTRPIAGVTAPDSPLITDTLFAAKIAQVKAIDCDQEVVAVGTILHDIGLTAGVPGANRFEVNGADAALSFIKERRLGIMGRWRPRVSASAPARPC